MEVGCYELQLYCDGCWGGDNPSPNGYLKITAINITDCRSQARTKGWKLGKRLLCPTCYTEKREQVRGE